jgi:hypothetical protein
MEPPKLWNSLAEVRTALLEAAFPDTDFSNGELGSIYESAAAHLVRTARELCDEGDEGMCVALQSLLWDGAVTVLEDAGFSLMSGGRANETVYDAFINGKPDTLVAEANTQPAEIIPFPLRPMLE